MSLVILGTAIQVAPLVGMVVALYEFATVPYEGYWSVLFIAGIVAIFSRTFAVVTAYLTMVTLVYGLATLGAYPYWFLSLSFGAFVALLSGISLAGFALRSAPDRHGADE